MLKKYWKKKCEIMNPNKREINVIEGVLPMLYDCNYDSNYVSFSVLQL